jgi:hypothetical protein
LLQEELSSYLAERIGELATPQAAPFEESLKPVIDFVNGIETIDTLSPVDLTNFALYCKIGFHLTVALLIKGEWEWFIMSRLPAGKSVNDVIDEGLPALRELSSGFNASMDKGSRSAALYRLLESQGGVASAEGYDEKDLHDFVKHMVLAEVQMFAGKSPEVESFVQSEESQRRLLKGASTVIVEEFWKKKRIWMELESEVEGLLLKLEEQSLRNRRSQREWMGVFGNIYIPLLEAEYLYNSLSFRIKRKTDEPELTPDDLDLLEAENNQQQKELISKLKKEALSFRKNLPGPGGMPYDYEEMDSYEKECKKLLRKIWRLTHPDRIEQEKFTPEQKRKLRAYFEEAVPYQEGGLLDDEEIALSMRSLVALKELLAKVEAVWKSMGLDCNEQSVIRGETLSEQCDWLDGKIRELEEEAALVRVELMAAANDPEFREMDACMASPEQMERVTVELSAKLAWYHEQNSLLEKRLAGLFGE